jgi:peptide/nickel transport system permease protein
MWRIGYRRLKQNKVAVVSAIFLITMILMAVVAPYITPKDPNQVNILLPHQSPSGEHWLGTDESGRDIVSRLIVGARASMTVGITSMLISISIGMLVGSIAGFIGGWVDAILMRFTDGMMAIPYFFLVLIVVAVFGTSFRNIVIVIGATSWMVVARVVRSEVIRYRNYEFVAAARSIGANDARILFRHVVPHTFPSIIVAATIGVGPQLSGPGHPAAASELGQHAQQVPGVPVR